PRRGKVCLNRLKLPPYRLGDTAIELPAPARFRIARVMALCPEASSSPAAPPSRAATRSSTADWAGLVSRLETGPTSATAQRSAADSAVGNTKLVVWWIGRARDPASESGSWPAWTVRVSNFSG